VVRDWWLAVMVGWDEVGDGVIKESSLEDLEVSTTIYYRESG